MPVLRSHDTQDHAEATVSQVADRSSDTEFCRRLVETHPNLISGQPLFLSNAHANEMQDVIHAIETVATHSYRFGPSPATRARLPC